MKKIVILQHVVLIAHTLCPTNLSGEWTSRKIVNKNRARSVRIFRISIILGIIVMAVSGLAFVVPIFGSVLFPSERIAITETTIATIGFFDTWSYVNVQPEQGKKK